MSGRLLSLFCVLAVVSSGPAQTANDPNEGSRLTADGNDNYTFSWWGRSGRTYFLQHSEDLMSWVFFPDVIEPGGNAPLSYGFNVTGPDRYFLRLKYSDIPTSNPSTADFDDDGLSNADELQRGTDPLNPDTDNDGVNDGNEVLQGRNPLKGAIADSTGTVNLMVFTPLE